MIFPERNSCPNGVEIVLKHRWNHGYMYVFVYYVLQQYFNVFAENVFAATILLLYIFFSAWLSTSLFDCRMEMKQALS